MSRLGDILRECREQRHEAMRVVAARAEVPERSIHRLETGDGIPDPWRIPLFADAYYAPIGELTREYLDMLEPNVRENLERLAVAIVALQREQTAPAPLDGVPARSKPPLPRSARRTAR